MHADVIAYDTNAGWSPSLNESKGTGGFEVHMVQIASWLARQHYSVVVFSHFDGAEDGVVYLDSRKEHGQWSCKCLLICRSSPIPDFVLAERTIALQCDDPRPCPEKWSHLRGVVMTCVSHWQAGLFRDLGFQVMAVIPPMIQLPELSGVRPPRRRGRLVCMSAWNKGTDETLEAWGRVAPAMSNCHFMVGSPYSHPADAAKRCEAVGAMWCGEVTPMTVRRWLATAEAVFRVNVAPETFGVTDALAEHLGAEVYMLCRNGFGASREVLSSPWVTDDSVEFESYAVSRRQDAVIPKRDLRVHKIMPQWLPVLFGGN